MDIFFTNRQTMNPPPAQQKETSSALEPPQKRAQVPSQEMGNIPSTMAWACISTECQNNNRRYRRTKALNLGSLQL